MAVPDSGKKYANAKYTRGAVLFAGVLPALLCLVVVVLLMRARGSGVRHEDVAIGCWAAACGVFAVAAARLARLAIIATPRRLTVRNFWSTRHVAWSRIERIEPPPALKVRRNAVYGQTGPGLRITLTGGRVIVASAYARRRVDPVDFADTVVRELQQAAKVLGNTPSVS